VKEFFILLLLLEAGLIGVFVSLDLFLFYFFWEATLIPMALLIGMYGHGRRVYAAIKFFLYTMIASVFMLAGFFGSTPRPAVLTSSRFRPHPQRRGAGFCSCCTMALPGILHCICRESPLFPFHTWLPDAHVEAPTAGSVLLQACC